MKNAGKKFVSALLVFCMSIALLPTFAGAEGTLTRSEWISQLVDTFSMTIENDDNMPDNYFNDINSDMPYYRDILLAVEFGVINIEAGQNFYPDEVATREFAAQTINACLAFQLGENTEYTYSEYESVTYPDDIQVSINQGWFALSDGNFLPEQPVTTEEAETIFDSAKKIIDSEKIDENYNSTYKFAENVIVVPENSDVTIDSDYTVTISDCETEIAKDDIFVVYSNGFPVALKALNIKTVENNTVISATKDGAEGAILSADSQGSIALDLSKIELEDSSTYLIQNVAEPYSLTQELTIGQCTVARDYEENKWTFNYNFDLDGETVGSVGIEVGNPTL